MSILFRKHATHLARRGSVGGSPIPLDNFGLASFGRVYTGVSNTNGVKIGAAIKSIATAGAVYEVTMVPLETQ